MTQPFRPALSLVPLFLVTAVVPALAQAQAGKKPAAVNLTAVLDGKAWQASPLSGKADHAVVAMEGRPALVVGPSGLDLTTAAPLTGPTEIRAVLRFTSPKDVGTNAYLFAGLKKPNASVENPLLTHLQIPGGPAYSQSLYWSAQPMPGRKEGPSGVYYVKNLPRDRLTWPELTRRRVEHDAAAQPSLGQRWITVRYLLRKNAVQVYLDDRLLRDGRDPKLDTTGHFRLRLYNHMQLRSLSLHDLPPEDRRFEMVPLAGYVNSGQFGGQTVKREGMSGTVTVGGVKFALPGPDAQGRDHVDLGPSWLRSGLLEGAFDGWEGSAARWRGALSRDPARIQFRVRYRPYSRLHLLAAFTGDADTTPVVTAQFYRANAGHPVNFAVRVPLFTAPAQVHAMPVQLANGARGNLHLVTIPLDPNGVAAFSDLDDQEHPGRQGMGPGEEGRDAGSPD